MEDELTPEGSGARSLTVRRRVILAALTGVGMLAVVVAVASSGGGEDSSTLATDPAGGSSPVSSGNGSGTPVESTTTSSSTSTTPVSSMPSGDGDPETPTSTSTTVATTTTLLSIADRYPGAFSLPVFRPRPCPEDYPCDRPSVGIRRPELLFGNDVDCVWMARGQGSTVDEALLTEPDMVLWPEGYFATLDPPRVIDEKGEVIWGGARDHEYNWADTYYQLRTEDFIDQVPEECRTSSRVVALSASLRRSAQ